MENKSPSVLPVPKIASAGTIGTITTLVIWALKTYAGVELPPEAAAALATILGFLAGYITPPKGF